MVGTNLTKTACMSINALPAATFSNTVILHNAAKTSVVRYLLRNTHKTSPDHNETHTHASLTGPYSKLESP